MPCAGAYGGDSLPVVYTDAPECEMKAVREHVWSLATYTYLEPGKSYALLPWPRETIDSTVLVKEDI